MPLPLGSEAPVFTLPVAVGQDPVSLADYRGKSNVVLLFFPLAFSGRCTEELCQVQEDLSVWSELDAAVLGISVDSIFVNPRFAAEHGITFPLLSDFNREVATAYGVRNDNFFGMKGVANRSAFVVDRGGLVRYAWTSEDAEVLPDFGALQEVLREMGSDAAG